MKFSAGAVIATYLLLSMGLSQADTPINGNDERLLTLTDNCYSAWAALDWTIGQDGSLAKNNDAFRTGIQRICRAQAELFMEGYEIAPLIEPDSQEQIYPLVFRETVEEIKQYLLQGLPALKLI